MGDLVIPFQILMNHAFMIFNVLSPGIAGASALFLAYYLAMFLIQNGLRK